MNDHDAMSDDSETVDAEVRREAEKQREMQEVQEMIRRMFAAAKTLSRGIQPGEALNDLGQGSAPASGSTSRAPLGTVDE